MNAYNKKHKKKHTTRTKFKIPKGTIKEFSVKLNSIIEYSFYWNKKEFIKH